MRDWFKEISKNIFPGFVVSLIALPLSLGLALASGVPPIAGIITAIVGGVIVSLLGGSNLTITGPGNGLVVATLTAVTVLGAGDPLQGYLYTLAAIVISGALIFTLGLLRFGNLGDFFPSAAIRGMLAAIGLIIMSKQIHVMFGVVSPEGNTPAELYWEIASTLSKLWAGEIPFMAWGIGIFSLLLMVFYPMIRARVFHLVPAPMWIVMLSIMLTLLTNKEWLNLEPLSPQYLIKIPDNFLSELALPDFSKFRLGSFWGAVFSLSLIAIIESLLSIKGVDRLDVRRRRSNVNKDLRALGLATMASGALGGLNVVTVIARSSVNVNNGATGRSANFFQAVFIFLFVLLFSAQIQMIPLPALAAVLVYTGYKLAEPRVFRSIAAIGREQLAIFLITMITTLLTSLIIGIGAGILVTLLFQLRVLRHIKLFVRYTFRPNTLLYKETNGQYHLSVKAFSNFMNFIGLRKQLDSVPRTANLIVDFSLTEFVDDSVLEQLQDYYESFKEGGGDMEIIGLDGLSAKSNHPLAPRLPLSRVNNPKEELSRRQKALRLVALKLEWYFDHQQFYDFTDFKVFKYFQTRLIDRGRNAIQGRIGGIDVMAADLDYHEGEFITRESHHSTMALLKLPKEVPSFVMDKELLLDRVAHLAGFRDINFKMHPVFSQSFKLKGSDEVAIRRFFDDDLIEFFQSNKAFHIESKGNAILIFEKERLGILSEIKLLVSFASRLAEILNSKLDD